MNSSSSRPVLAVVDDDKGNMELYDRMIAKPLRLEFMGFTNPLEALFVLRDLRPQPELLIIDVIMPELDGAALLRLLRHAGVTTPAILASALDHDELRARYSDLAQSISAKNFSGTGGLPDICRSLMTSETTWTTASSA